MARIKSDITNPSIYTSTYEAIFSCLKRKMISQFDICDSIKVLLAVIVKGNILATNLKKRQ